MDILEAQNYSKGLLDQLYLLQQNKLHCDVRITAEGGGVSAHKVVLMAASSYLNSCFSTKIQSEVGSKGSIHIPNTPFRLIERVIHFIYTGKLAISKQDFEMTFKLCKDLEITSAISLCERYSLDQHDDEREVSTNETVVKEGTYQIEQTDVTMKSETVEGVAIPIEEVNLLSKEDTEKGHVQKTIKQGRKSVKETVVKGKTYPKRTYIKRESKSAGKQTKHTKVKPKRKVRSADLITASSEVNQDSEAVAIMIENAEGNVEDDEKICELDVDRVNENSFQREENDKAATNEDCRVSRRCDKIITLPVRKRKRKGVQKKLPGLKGKGTSEPNNIVKKEHKKKIKVRRFKQFPCPYCSRVLTNQKRLAFHEFSKHGTPFDESRYTMYPCAKEGCTYVSGSRSNLRTHLKSRHTDDRPHICEFCGKSFKLQSVLAIHLNLHTGSKDWKCNTCGEHFNQQSGLRVHIKRHHDGVSTWGELCHLCSEKFLQKSDLAWHLFRAHEQPLPEKYKAYVCDICNYLTKSSQDLQRHKNAHNGIKQFGCSFCKKSCSTKSQLKRHERFHGEKSFKCMYDNCSYACVDSIGLSKHVTLMHTHKNFKPYICPICSYKTGVKGNLDKHIRQVHFLDVVSKHTVQLKMKYAGFESGDIITKDGRLIASAKQRKEMHQKCLEENRMAFNSQEEMDCSVKSIIQNNEDKAMYNTNDQEITNKATLPYKHVAMEVTQESPTNSAINLSSVDSVYPNVNSSTVHLTEHVTSNVASESVIYLQEATNY